MLQQQQRKRDIAKFWHMCLEHMSERGLQVLHKRSALSCIRYCKLDLCKFCIIGKQYRVAFSTSQYKIKSLLDLIQTDVWGPSPVASIGGASYYVTFIDDFSRKVRVYFLKQNRKYFRSSRNEKFWCKIRWGGRWKSWGLMMEVNTPPKNSKTT